MADKIIEHTYKYIATYEDGTEIVVYEENWRNALWAIVWSSGVRWADNVVTIKRIRNVNDLTEVHNGKESKQVNEATK